MKNSQPKVYGKLILVLLVGDSSVGKTQMLHRFVKGTLPRNAVPTIGVEFATKTITLDHGDKIKLQIWDTAGQQRYRNITSAHYRRAVGALVFYDVTNQKSFENVRTWIKQVRGEAHPDIVIMLVGNKIDLIEKNPAFRKISQNEARLLAIENKVLFAEVSTFTNLNVNQCFERLIQEVVKIKTNKTKVDDQFE